MDVRIEVKPVEDKLFGLYINDYLFATSKTHFDADFGKQFLLKAFGVKEDPRICDLCERSENAPEHKPDNPRFKHHFNGIEP